jgi:aryl-alcohol dehydrogenase-like predicted oxidoreductase
MGLLSGKYASWDQIELQDIRQSQLSWNYFNSERLPGLLRQLDAGRSILTSDGRTLAQGALGWLWARSSPVIPIPGFKTVQPRPRRMSQPCSTARLRQRQMNQIDERLRRVRDEAVSNEHGGILHQCAVLHLSSASKMSFSDHACSS